MERKIDLQIPLNMTQIQAQKREVLRSRLRSIRVIFSAVIVLGVFWGLKLTGITMAGGAFCGIEEHVHDEACGTLELLCEQEEIPPHFHTDECLEKALVCMLEEIEGHIHAEDCMNKILLCDLEEQEGHSHTDDCYVKTLQCSIPEEPEHLHSSMCYEEEYVCVLEESEVHTHDDSCRSSVLTCTIAEAESHFHMDECYDRVDVCVLEDPEHLCDDFCYAEVLICSLEESDGHTHDESCMSEEITCALEESEGHMHDAECCISVLTCPLSEEPVHTHSEDCFTYECICLTEESDGHLHSEECFTVDTEIFLCGLEETEAHIHTEECYQPLEGSYICGLEETEGHLHIDECYESVMECSLPEHIHMEACYSNEDADLESEEDWENSLANLIRSPSTAENIVMVARSQLGVPESTRNFTVDDYGIRRGITRYGQWYGNPYGDWSAMFAAFCLEYAGVTGLPVNAGPESMRLAWEEETIYIPAADVDYPLVGQLLFLDNNVNGVADAVAVITDIRENVLVVVEGDRKEAVTELGTVSLTSETEVSEELVWDVVWLEAGTDEELSDENTKEEVLLPDQVMETLYDMNDPVIMGYGLVPFEPGLMLLPNEEQGTVLAAGAYTVWLDGTNGGLMSLEGADNKQYTVRTTTFTLPETWKSPTAYAYTLRGWYDVVNSEYYAPGDEVTVTQNLVFYADWEAETYNIGQFNAMTADTISTNEFVTTRMFDYEFLFNVLSAKVNNISYATSSHTETWTLLTSGKNPYNNKDTLNYIFRDWDANSDISYPQNTNSRNTYDASVDVHQGLAVPNLLDLLFDAETEVIGKHYLGTGDHLFQLCTDPLDEHYGYYYYDSAYNAASYNQRDERFYVYDYLVRASDSEGDSGSAGQYSDFLPLNSPYVNTNGKTPSTYTYDGENGEYRGVTHYEYEAQRSGHSPVHANYLFGMSIDIEFYLPDVPGTSGGNLDLYGKEMHFKFSGDDDVWVFVDDKLVLDLGGIHGIESGDINFSTGIVTINGTVDQKLTNALRTIPSGEQTLTMYYLERGSSQSNCAIYFNLAPRFSFSIEKEDFLTKDVLNGAQFSVYLDEACTIPAEDLWTSEEAHDADENSTNVFTVENGVATMWGMCAGKTYYIKETRPPDKKDENGVPIYSFSHGIICLTFDKTGTASYNVEMIGEGDSDSITNGFTVHGFQIDEETQQAYIVATNAPEWAQDVTSLEVRKVWEDDHSHSTEAVTVYLTVTDPDGTVRRLQEAQLSDANGWHHVWDNLLKYQDKNKTPAIYGVEESYVDGYYSKLEDVTDEGSYTFTTTEWGTATGFEEGKVYLLKTGSGYLSTNRVADDTGFMWIDEATAKTSPLARWTVEKSGSTYRLTNESGQIITFYYGNGSPTDFFAYTTKKANNDTNYKQYLTYSDGRLYFSPPNNSRTQYYIGSMMNNGKFNYTTDTNNAYSFSLITQTTVKITEEIQSDKAYLITNTPLTEETSLTVEKYWDYGYLEDSGEHETLQVTVKLLANGSDTGRTVTLSLKNHWSATFQGLPYTDSNGIVISYSVVESWKNDDWLPSYGEIRTNSWGSGTIPTYSTTITNKYIKGMGGPELPATGTGARMIYILCGGGILLASLVYGIALRRTRERRLK